MIASPRLQSIKGAIVPKLFTGPHPALIWYLNRDHFIDDEGQPATFLFSQVFVDDYMEDESPIDVWPPGALDAAKERIRRAKENGDSELFI